MPSQKEIDYKKQIGRKNLLTGNWGEQYISEKLSSFDCFVRHVPQGHDTGIDLYCETASEDKLPFQHFWCQVKTSKKYKGVNKCITINRQTRNMNVDYWLKQPIPVFIFIVPDLRDEDITQKRMIPFYIFSAIDFHNGRKKIKSSLKIQKAEDVEKFLNEDLLTQTFRWDLMRGRVSHLLTPEPSYTITFPKGQTLNSEEKLQKSLRWTLRLLADDILNQNDSEFLSRAKTYVEMLDILASGIGDKHYETYEAIGKYYRQTGDVQKALENYKKSLEQLNKDPYPEVSRDDILWKEVFECIDGIIQELESEEIGLKANISGVPEVFATVATNSSTGIKQ